MSIIFFLVLFSFLFFELQSTYNLLSLIAQFKDSGILRELCNYHHRHRFCFVFGGAACGIFAPQPGIKPTPPTLEAWRLNC